MSSTQRLNAPTCRGGKLITPRKRPSSSTATLSAFSSATPPSGQVRAAHQSSAEPGVVGSLLANARGIVAPVALGDSNVTLVLPARRGPTRATVGLDKLAAGSGPRVAKGELAGVAEVAGVRPVPDRRTPVPATTAAASASASPPRRDGLSKSPRCALPVDTATPVGRSERSTLLLSAVAESSRAETARQTRTWYSAI